LLIIIMGPFTGLPVFLRITQEFDKKRKAKAARRAITAAAILLFFFLFFGERLLAVFGITFDGFRIAGGIILLLLGIEYMFHINFGERRSKSYNTDIVVPFAMPLIVGPGVITTTILLTRQFGYVSTAIGALAAIGVYYVFLQYAAAIQRMIGEQGIEVIARFMGLMLMAIAVDMMRSGVVGFIQIGVGG
jgi:multiple antibiotic resistance protein